MAVDDDILKTLVRIEGLLRQSSTTTGDRVRTAAGRSPNMGKNGDRQVYKATAAAQTSLENSAELASKGLRRLSRTVHDTRGNFIALNKSMRVLTRDVSGARFRPEPRTAGSDSMDAAGMVSRALGQTRVGRQVERALGNFASSVSIARVTIISALSQLSDAILPVISDFYNLQRRGIDASSSLLDLYYNAARTGMSLSEYTQVLEESTNAVVRARSFDDFNEQLRATTGQLNSLGIFGADATKLAASMASAATSLGVPQAQLTAATSAQVKVFENLRKASLMTAEGFQELVASVSANENVQGELLGLAPQERAARLAQLVQTQAIGRQLGLTADQSKALGEAMLAQRKLSAPQRFQAAGRIRQAGAMLGMGAGDTEELARLAMIRTRSPEQTKRFLALGGKMQQAIERGLSAYDIQEQHLAEQLQEALNGTGIGDQLKAAGIAQLGAESGPVLNKQIAEKTTESASILMNILTVLQGFGKNPVGAALTSALGSAAFGVTLALAFKGALGPTLLKMFRHADRVKDATAPQGPGFLLAVGKGLGRGARAIGGIPGALLRGVGGVGSALWGGARAAGSATAGAVGQISSQGIGQASKGLLTPGARLTTSLTGALANTTMGVLGQALGGLTKMIRGAGWLGALVGGVGELFTGEMGAALNAESASWGGEGLKGLLGQAFGKHYDIIGGALRGLGTGILSIGEFAIDAWNWSVGSFVESAKIELSSSFTNTFDLVWTWLTIQFKKIKLKLAESFGLTSVAESIQKDIEVAEKTRVALEADGQATLNTIGKKNQAAAEEQKRLAAETEKTMTATAASVNAAAQVVTSTKGLATAVTRQAGAIAAPAQLSRPSVTQPQVNTPAAPSTAANAPAGAGSDGTAGVPPPPTLSDVLTSQFSTIIDLLRQSVSAEQAQTLATEALARATGAPFLPSLNARSEAFVLTQR